MRMNNAALALAAATLGNFQPVTLPKGKVLYHGARSKSEIDGFRANAMFTSDLCYAVDYAFLRDLPTPLHRTLFCCTLQGDVSVLEIVGVDWPSFCLNLHSADPSLPSYDGWLQGYLPEYLSLTSKGQVHGALLHSGSPGALDEIIFTDARALCAIHRRID